MTNHETPRMHNRPHDPAYQMLDQVVTEQRVMREGCYICEDREFARLGMPLCSPCCECRKWKKTDGHIAADGSGTCDDCMHVACRACFDEPAQGEICTCATPCCEVDIGVGIMTCQSYHCPTHGGSHEG